MRYITEYITITSTATEAKLSYVPVYISETSSYALLHDSLKIFKSDFSAYLPLWGEIVKKADGFYVLFNLEENLTENYVNVVVTYGVLDTATAPNINYNNLLNSSNAFVDSATAISPIDYSQYITSHIEYLASQYRNSERLKGVIGSFLSMAQDIFLVSDTIPYMLDLESANGVYLDLIGKIVGVGRRYCGNFLQTLNLSIDKYKHALTNIEEIVLTDDCMRKLIKVKIQKNVKEIVNYKELNEIITDFLEMDTFIEPCNNYRIKVDVGNIDREKAKCLILLRAFLPLPPTIELMYIESMETVADDSYSSALAPVQVSTEEAYNEPYIFVQDVDVAKNMDKWSHVSTTEAIDEPYLYIDDKDKALNIERETQLYTTNKEQ